MVVGGAVVIWVAVSLIAVALCRMAALGDSPSAEVEPEAPRAGTAEPGLASSLIAAVTPAQASGPAA